jgi:hypothetical protein
MRKLLLTILALPILLFSSSDSIETPYESTERVNLQYVWHEIDYGDFLRAKEHLRNEVPSSFDDVMYIQLARLYIAMKKGDRLELIKVRTEIDEQLADYFGIYENY